MSEAMTARERRQARTKDEILNAAIELIMEQGIDNLQMREVAKRVDYSIGGLYQYFASKDEIINAACIEGDRRLTEYIKAVPTTLPLKTYLCEVGEAYIQFARQNPNHFAILFSMRTVGIAEPFAADAPEMEGSFGILMTAVMRGIEAGQIQVTEGFGAWEITYNLWAIVHGMATLEVSYLRDFKFDFETANRHGLEIFVAGLVTD